MHRVFRDMLTLLRSASVAATVVASLASARAGLASELSADETASPGESSSDDATKAGAEGLDLGEFRIRTYYPSESQRSTVCFSLYATVDKDKRTDSQNLLGHRLHKVRDQVIVVTRLVPLADFNDPELKSFRRRILSQLLRTLPELSIDNVYVSDFELSVERI